MPRALLAGAFLGAASLLLARQRAAAQEVGIEDIAASYGVVALTPESMRAAGVDSIVITPARITGTIVEPPEWRARRLEEDQP